VRVRYTENASVELRRIVEYIAHDNPLAADAVVQRVEQVAARLAQFSGMGHSCDVSGVVHRVFMTRMLRSPGDRINS
jgi:plasmid stabilization system protein ParE